MEAMRKTVEAPAIDDAEIDCIALLKAVMAIHGNELNNYERDRIAIWFHSKYKIKDESYLVGD